MHEDLNFKAELLPGLKTKVLIFRHSSFFQEFNSFVIILYAILLGLKSFQINSNLLIFLEICDNLITFYFVIEIIIKLASDGYKKFFYDYWNIFDFIVILFSLPIFGDTNSAAIRIFRIFRIIVINQELKKLLGVVFSSISAILNISILISMFIYIYAVVGNLWFSTIPNGNWANVGIAMLTLFKVMTGDDWYNVMFDVIDQYPWAIFFFLSFIIFATYVFLSLFVAIIIDEIQKLKSNSIDKELEKHDDNFLLIKKDLELIKKLLKDKNEIS